MAHKITRDPFCPNPVLRTVYVVYANIAGQWVLAGFTFRKRLIRKPQTAARRFAYIRQKLGLHRDTPVTLVDLATAQHNIQETGKGVSVMPLLPESLRPRPRRT